MKEYFIREIDIEKLYYLSDLKIKLDSTKRQHLLLTGKNGSGKTSLLLKIVKYLQVIHNEMDPDVFCPEYRCSSMIIEEKKSEEYEKRKAVKRLQKYQEGLEEKFN